MKMKKRQLLRELLSANIKNRRETLDISQEKLAELADVSIQTIKGIEGRRTWVSDTMLEKLSQVLGVSAFQLLIPADKGDLNDDNALIAVLLGNLRQNIQKDINNRFDRLKTCSKTSRK
jgi:transcriptional regulator with XRE-family HTH domain